MAVVIETLMGEDLELGIEATTKTHPSGGTLNGTQISLSTFSIAGAAGYARADLWAPGTIAAGSQEYYVMNVDGASLGDKVLASLTSIGDVPLLLSAHVSSENHVTVVLANLTGDSQTIAEGTVSVLVFHHRVEDPTPQV